MYSAAAIAVRRCVATRRDGTSCAAWARWDDPQQRCIFHARDRAVGPPVAREGVRPHQHARYVPCRCGGYPMPHRPGGGSRCAWPNVQLGTSAAVPKTAVPVPTTPPVARAERRGDPLRNFDIGAMLRLGF
jgi:hypothetical protein